MTAPDPGFFYALGHASGTHDTGPFTSFIYRFDPLFESDTIVDLSSVVADEEYVFKIVISDSLFLAQTSNHIYLLDRSFNVLKKVDLQTPSSQVLLAKGYFVAFETAKEGTGDVQVFTLDGVPLLEKSMNEFSKAVVFNGNFTTLGRDNVIRQYDPSTLQIVDSLEAADEILELKVLDQLHIEIVTQKPDEQRQINVYNHEFELKWTIITELPGEQSLKAVIAGDYYYLKGTYYFRAKDEHKQTGLIPFIRKNHLTFPEKIARSSVDFVEVNIVNVPAADTCQADQEGTVRCTFGENIQIQYSITLINSGDQPVHQLSIHTEQSLPLAPWDPHCFTLDVPYHLMDTLKPGEQLTILDSTNFFENTNPTLLNFYLIAPNQRLHENRAILSTNVDFTTSSTQTPRESFKVFPNPTTGPVWIEGPSSKIIRGLVSIYDFRGIKLKQMDFNDNFINLSSLSPGIYTMHFHAPSVTWVQRIVKQ